MKVSGQVGGLREGSLFSAFSSHACDVLDVCCTPHSSPEEKELMAISIIITATILTLIFTCISGIIFMNIIVIAINTSIIIPKP